MSIDGEPVKKVRTLIAKRVLFFCVFADDTFVISADGEIYICFLLK